MKTFILLLFIGCSFLTVNGQVASVNNSDLLHIDSSHKSKRVVTKASIRSVITLNKLSENISDNLSKSDLLRKNVTNGALVLEISLDINGGIKSYKVSESNSSLMSNIVLDMMEYSDSLTIGDKELKGISKIKIPVRYSL